MKMSKQIQKRDNLREAKKELENIIAINGEGDLFDIEKELAFDLGIELESYN